MYALPMDKDSSVAKAWDGAGTSGGRQGGKTGVGWGEASVILSTKILKNKVLCLKKKVCGWRGEMLCKETKKHNFY